MRTLKKFIATSTLILALAGLAAAGEIDAPPVAKPTPPPTVSTTAVDEGSAEDSLLGLTLDVVWSILSIF